MPFEYLKFVAHRFGVAASIAGVPIFRHQPERHLLATATNPQRRMGLLHTFGFVDWFVDGVIVARERRIVFRPHLDDDLTRFTEGAHAVACLREAIAIGAPLMLIPARAQPAIESPVA